MSGYRETDEPEELEPSSFDPDPTDLHDAPGELPPLTDEEAERIIARYNRHLAHAETLKVNAEALIKTEQQRCQRLMDREGERLQVWLAGKLRGKARSHRTLEGIAGFRSVPARLTVTDESRALAWCRENATFAVVAKVNPRLLGVQVYTATNQETGEESFDPPPGFAVEPERTVFYIKPTTGRESGGKGGEE